MIKICGLLFLILSTQAHAFQTLYIVRHAEKQDGGGKDPALSIAGQKRAMDLAWHLRDANVQAVYATEFQRTRKTAEPLALQHGLKISMSEHDSLKFAAQLLADKSKDTALIVGHSNTVVDLIKALGFPVSWEIGENEFDRLLIVTLVKPEPVLSILRY